MHAAVAACSCCQYYFSAVVVSCKNDVNQHRHRKSIAHIAAPTKPGTCVRNNRSMSHASQHTTFHIASHPNHQHDDYDHTRHRHPVSPQPLTVSDLDSDSNRTPYFSACHRCLLQDSQAGTLGSRTHMKTARENKNAHKGSI